MSSGIHFVRNEKENCFLSSDADLCREEKDVARKHCNARGGLYFFSLKWLQA